MKNANEQKEYFRISFPKVIIGLCIAIYALCGAGIAVSLYQTIRFGIRSFTEVLKYPFLIAISALCIVLVTAILIKSQYVVDEKKFTMQYGLIKSSIPVKNITSLIFNTTANKLTVYCGEQYLTLSVPSTRVHDLIEALRKRNTDIEYSFISSNDGKN